MAWWIEATWAHCGAIVRQDDGAIVYETEYADARPLLSWLLGLGDAAELIEPAELRERLAGQLRHLEGLLDGEPPTAEAGAAACWRCRQWRRRRSTADWRVEVDRFTRLYGADHLPVAELLGEADAVLDIAAVRADLGASAEELRADVRLLNRVNFGADAHLPRRVQQAARQDQRDVRPDRTRLLRGRRRPRRCRPIRCCWPSSSSAASCRRPPARLSPAPPTSSAPHAGTPRLRQSDSSGARRQDPRRRQRGHRRPASARDRVLDGGHGQGQPAHGGAVPPRPQPRRVVLRVPVSYRRRQRGVFRVATTKSAEPLDEELRRRSRWKSSCTGAKASPPRKLCPPHRHHLVQLRSAPLGRGAPAGTGAGGRFVPRRAALRGRALAVSSLLPAIRRQGAPRGAPGSGLPTCALTVRRLLALYA